MGGGNLLIGKNTQPRQDGDLGRGIRQQNATRSVVGRLIWSLSDTDVPSPKDGGRLTEVWYTLDQCVSVCVCAQYSPTSVPVLYSCAFIHTVQY